MCLIPYGNIMKQPFVYGDVLCALKTELAALDKETMPSRSRSANGRRRTRARMTTRVLHEMGL